MLKIRLVCPHCNKTNGCRQINDYVFAYCDKHQTKWLIGFAKKQQSTNETIDNDTYLWDYSQVEPRHRMSFFKTNPEIISDITDRR